MHRKLMCYPDCVLVVVSGDAQVPGPHSVGARIREHSPPPVPPLDNSVPSQYCVGCHNQRAKTAGLALDTMDYATSARTPRPGKRSFEDQDRHDAARAARAVRSAPRSTRSRRSSKRAWTLRLPLEPNPGTPALHRLNRTEYANAIRDLLALDVDVAALLPPDDASEGFDNIADALGTVAVAHSGLRFGGDEDQPPRGRRPDADPDADHLHAPGGLAQDRNRGLPLGTRGGMLVRHTFPLDAEYEFSVTADRRRRCGGATVDVTLDGEKLDVTQLRAASGSTSRPGRTRSARASWIARGAGVDDPYSDFRVNSAFTPGGGVNRSSSPARSTPPARATRRAAGAIFVCQPGRRPAEEAQLCARQIVSTLARRAYRRPVIDREVDDADEVLSAGPQGRRLRGRHPAGAGAHPGGPGVPVPGRRGAASAAPTAPSTASAISTWRRGCRSSCGAASRTTNCSTWRSRAGSAIRRCSSSRSSACSRIRSRQALIDNFAGQWLYLRELAKRADVGEELRRQPPSVVPARNRDAFREHRPRGSQHRRSARCGLHVRRRAAGAALRHSEHPRQLLPPRARCDAASPRRGLLGQGSILTVTRSARGRRRCTRGRWILENVLGTPAPSRRRASTRTWRRMPEQVKVTSLRQRLEAHRGRTRCAVVPQDHGPDRLRAGKLRSGRHLARARRQDADRLRPASSWTARS